MSKIVEQKFMEAFKDKETFSRAELFDFFRFLEPDIKDGTLTWRIHDLKNKNIIKSIQTGQYIISGKATYAPEISDDILKLSNATASHFKDVNYCAWDTNWMNEFTQHQLRKKMIIVEIEKDFVESLYYHLKDTFQYDFYVNPDEKVIELYIAESQCPVIIKKLITRSPIGKRLVKGIKLKTPKLEKILVDLFAESKLLYFYQGAELIHIFQNAIKKYPLNYTKLFSYAKRREQEIAIKQFIDSHMQYLVKDIIQ